MGAPGWAVAGAAGGGWASADRLLLRNCRLPDGRAASVRLAAGRIASVEPATTPVEPASTGTQPASPLAAESSDWPTLDLAGQLLTPGLTDPHLHPDKAFGLEADAGAAASTLAEALAHVRAAKSRQTAELICARTLRLAEWCLALGTTRARVHAEVDPLLGLRSVEGVLQARAHLAGRMHLQVVAFPQEGIVREPGTLELMRQALHLGCEVVGAISYQDADPRQHFELTAALAREFDLPLDVHADFGVPVEHSALGTLADVVQAAGLGGRTLAGHATTLAAMDESLRARTVARLADAGVGVCALPRTDLFMDGRVAPLETLRQAGVGTCLGTNNVLNAFTPVGRPSLPSAAAVYALAGRVATRPALDALARSLWTAACQVAPGMPVPAVAAGAPADLCVWPCGEAWQIVATEADPVLVFVGGRLVQTRQPMPANVVSTEQRQPPTIRLPCQQ